MEGFFESFLYLIIAIVILILSMKGSRKKQGSQTDTREESHGEPAYEPVVQDYPDDYKKTGDIMKTAGATQEEEESTPWISEKNAKASVINVDSVLREAQSNPIAEQEGQLESLDENYNKKKTRKPPIDFDLKKAVVFSSILERREY